MEWGWRWSYIDILSSFPDSYHEINKYSLRFILVVVLGLCTQIKETFNFTYFQNKNTITNTPNHISTIYQPIEK
ncbi:hypothetical protein N665_0373s0026 [Sinapis alba]|nr:hypothetical protein N665_0373s0026 [Sinapis alba]